MLATSPPTTDVGSREAKGKTCGVQLVLESCALNVTARVGSLVKERGHTHAAFLSFLSDP